MISAAIQNKLGRRLLVGVAAAVVSFGAITAEPASAWDYDATLITASGAASVAGVQCGPYSGNLAITLGTNGVAPHYFAYAIKGRYATTWTWSNWQSATGMSFVQGPIIPTTGDWQVIVAIAHWSNGAYYYDSEFARVTNDHPLYGNSPFCHVGF